MRDLGMAISDEDIDWIARYIDNSAPSGNEINGQRMWLEFISPYTDSQFSDVYGNATAVINPDEKFKVVIEAHADEIAWYVHRITRDGFLHVEKNGGSDAGIAPSQKVRIHTHRGVVSGVFGWPAIHTRKKSSHSLHPKEDTIFIDCGCRSNKEVEKLGIRIGDCVTYEAGLAILNKEYLVGRGLDNKIGGFMIAAIARKLRENNIVLPFGLYIVNAVQEEVGLKGAGMVAAAIRPNCAVVTDVKHATRTPLVNRNKNGEIELTLGPVITKAPSVHNKLREHIVKIADDSGLPYQLAVASKKTGTDADAFAYAAHPTPSALISLPLRYMHTTVETASLFDIACTMNLLMKVLTSLRPDFDFKYF